MTETLIKVDLNQPATTNENVHNRWHRSNPAMISSWNAMTGPAAISRTTTAPMTYAMWI